MAQTSVDPFDLDRFVRAQASAYALALAELKNGRKRSHWIWYVFPQLAGLGSSAMSYEYGIKSSAEARAYLDHPVLGPRLIECSRVVVAIEGRTAHEIFGSPDDLKFRSCMTLFSTVAPEQSEFAEALSKFYGGVPDGETVKMLAGTR